MNFIHTGFYEKNQTRLEYEDFQRNIQDQNLFFNILYRENSYESGLALRMYRGSSHSVISIYYHVLNESSDNPDDSSGNSKKVPIFNSFFFFMDNTNTQEVDSSQIGSGPGSKIGLWAFMFIIALVMMVFYVK